MRKHYFQFMNNDAITQRLLEIARAHIHLALEHSKANTSPDRREAIRSEIRWLRTERDALLDAGLESASDG